MTIAGSHLDGAQDVEFGGVPATSFSYNAATGAITAVSPPDIAGTVAGDRGHAGRGDDRFRRRLFHLHAGAGRLRGGGRIPALIEGGTTVTISGTNFSGATAVDFGGVAATNVDVVSSTQITATSPAGTGTVDVTVTTPDGTSATSPADQFTYNDVPVVTGDRSFDRSAAGRHDGDDHGHELQRGDGRHFGGVDVPVIDFMVNGGGTTITVPSPADTAGTVDVTVVDSESAPRQTSPADRFTFGAAPMVTGISPADGPLAGARR